MPSCWTYEVLSAFNVLDNHRKTCLARDPKARQEQIIEDRVLAAVISGWTAVIIHAVVFSPQCAPRHPAIAVRLTRWTCHDHRRIPDLPAVQSEHVLENKLAGMLLHNLNNWRWLRSFDARALIILPAAHRIPVFRVCFGSRPHTGIAMPLDIEPDYVVAFRQKAFG